MEGGSSSSEDAEEREEDNEEDFKDVWLVFGVVGGSLFENAEEEGKEDDFAGKREAELRRGSIKMMLMRRLKKKLVILIAGIMND